MAMYGSTDRSAKAQERYVLRPVALCCILAAGCVLLLIAGLRLVMAIRGVRLVLGLVLLVASGLLFVGVYLLGRCAVIVDGQGNPHPGGRRRLAADALERGRFGQPEARSAQRQIGRIYDAGHHDPRQGDVRADRK